MAERETSDMSFAQPGAGKAEDVAGWGLWLLKGERTRGNNCSKENSS